MLIKKLVFNNNIFDFLPSFAFRSAWFIAHVHSTWVWAVPRRLGSLKHLIDQFHATFLGLSKKWILAWIFKRIVSCILKKCWQSVRFNRYFCAFFVGFRRSVLGGRVCCLDVLSGSSSWHFIFRVWSIIYWNWVAMAKVSLAECFFVCNYLSSIYFGRASEYEPLKIWILHVSINDSLISFQKLILYCWSWNFG